MNKIDTLSLAKLIAKDVKELGGNTYYVGGYVRDKLLGIPNKDIDIEIHNITPNQLETILNKYGNLQTIGKSFGIFNIKGYDLDIAMPRIESNTGRGHKDFEVFVDPFIGEKNACKRRDFTINALMEDVLTGEIKDYFNGLEDLKSKTIKHIDDKTFIEDPLRVLRACGFASRFNFNIDNKTLDLIKTIDISTLPRDRIAGELDKVLLKSNKPSLFFENLDKCNQTKWFKEIFDLKNIPQSKKYHPEGNAYIHTMLVLDEASKNKKYVSNPRNFLVAALCHDFGKANSLSFDKDNNPHTYKHEITGLPLIKDFLSRIYNNNELEKYVCNMTQNHMIPHQLIKDKSKDKSFYTLYDNCINPNDLILLNKCDDLGRGIEIIDIVKTEQNQILLKEKLKEYRQLMKEPMITGKDLIDLGLKPSPLFKIILDKSHKLHLSGIKKDHILGQVCNSLEGEDKKLLKSLLQKQKISMKNPDKDITR